MTNKELFDALKAPFSPDKVEWRLARKSKDKSKGEVLAYIDSRAIQDRLNDVLGEENWEVTYIPIDMGTITVSTYNGEVQKAVKGFLSTITITLPDGKKISRQDGGGCTDFEPFKGGVSGAFKRAASALGIGRYLYNLPTTWVPIDQWGNFKKPQLPQWALPAGMAPTTNERPNASNDEYEQSIDSLIDDEIPFGEDTSPNNTEIVFERGKYANKPVSSVTDYGYLGWVVEQSHFSEAIKAAAKAVLDKYHNDMKETA